MRHAATEAAKFGAVGALTKSVTKVSMNTAHTKIQSYDDGVKKIPVAALSIEDTHLLARLCARGAFSKLQIAL